MVDALSTGFLPPERWLDISARLHLSRREAQIVSLILHDEGEARIAEALGISSHTVHTHLERLYRKLHVSSRCQVVLCVFREYVRLEQVSRLTFLNPGEQLPLVAPPSGVGYPVDTRKADG